VSGGRPAGIGLACAGGVVEGAFYEIGVLCALDECVDGLDLNDLDVYVGVSAGAILTACLANGIRPAAIARALLSGEADPESLTPEQVFVPALGAMARRASRAPATALRAVAKHLARPGDLSLFGALLELATALPPGLFDNTPLEQHLAGIFELEGRTNDFRELDAVLRVVAVELDTAELVAFGDPPTAHIPISRAVQASTALPMLYCPVEIDGRYYIDGVARRTLNASQALSAGVGLLLCVNPIVPIDLRAAGDGVSHASVMHTGLPGVLSQTFRTMIHSRRVAGFRNYAFAYPDADVVLIEPSVGDHSMFFTNIFSFSNRHDVLEHGYATTRDYLRRNAVRLDPVLRRHGLRLDHRALRERKELVPTVARRTATEVLDDTWSALDRLEQALRRLADAVPAGDGGPGVGSPDHDSGPAAAHTAA
jgi:NTE family protein